MNGLTFLELDYEINILKDSESLSLSVHLSFVISINHRIFVHLKRTVHSNAGLQDQRLGDFLFGTAPVDNRRSHRKTSPA